MCAHHSSLMLLLSLRCCMHKKRRNAIQLQRGELNGCPGVFDSCHLFKIVESSTYKPENIKRRKFQIRDKNFGPIIEARQLITNPIFPYGSFWRGWAIDVFSNYFVFSQEFLITKMVDCRNSDSKYFAFRYSSEFSKPWSANNTKRLTHDSKGK